MSDNSTILQNSYWLLDGEGENAKVVAICEICAKKLEKGWFWDGKNLGYGDYDIHCNECKNTIYMRNNNVIKTTDKEQQQ